MKLWWQDGNESMLAASEFFIATDFAISSGHYCKRVILTFGGVIFNHLRAFKRDI